MENFGSGEGWGGKVTIFSVDLSHVVEANGDGKPVLGHAGDNLSGIGYDYADSAQCPEVPEAPMHTILAPEDYYWQPGAA